MFPIRACNRAVAPLRRAYARMATVRMFRQLGATRHHPVARAITGDKQPCLPVVLPPVASSQALEKEQRWIATIIASWLNDEWTELSVHTELGDAAAEAYAKSRLAGEDDVSNLVLDLSQALLSFNYRETFTNAFEVANKVAEILMLRQGCDVCCVSDQDKARVDQHRNILE